MKIVSWNVNGFRSILKKGFLDFVRAEKADVICLQETKCGADDVDVSVFTGYQVHLSCAEKKGYSGTAILTRVPALNVTEGLGNAKHDQEGRVQTAEFPSFFLVNVYTPNSQRTLERLPYRTEEWDVDFLKYITKLEKKKPVVFCGDLNVSHTEIDLANPKANRGEHGFTDEERAGFDNLLKAGFVDTFRIFEKGPGHYTWWSQRPGVRARNIGWRLDYFLVSKALVPRVKAASIRKDVMGSDHAPITLDIAAPP